MKDLDIVVVGSGCSAAMASQTLVEAGKSVTMLDVGVKSSKYSNLIPNKDFLSIRRTENDQYRYLIGDEAEGVTSSGIGKGAQITPPRLYMLDKVDDYLAVKSRSFSPFESLGYGGLGIAWGLQCWEFSKKEIEATGLNSAYMDKAYKVVASRIGISATNDDAAKYTLGSLDTYQKSPTMDRNHELIFNTYKKRKAWFDNRNIYLGRTPLALITKDFRQRVGYKYRDLDFYSDKDLSGWRPWITIDQLKKQPNFEYIGSKLVVSFTELKDGVKITCLDTDTNSLVEFKARKLVLTAGALGTARIVLRSLNGNSTKLPLLCNPYTYLPCLQPRMFGKQAEKKKLGFGQLSMFIDSRQDNYDLSIATLYSYQSLMIFRTINQLPLNFQDGLQILRYLITGLVITGIQHGDHVNINNKFIKLIADTDLPTGDKLYASYTLNDKEKSAQREIENTYIKSLRKLHTYPVKRLQPGHGSSVHYAGTLPFKSKSESFSLSPEGRLWGTKNVYVADSSGFNFLPARGLTFSLMANAHITAENVLKDEG